MSETIYQKIEEKGRQEAEEIILDAKRRAQELTDEIISEASLKKEEIIKKATRKKNDELKTYKTTYNQAAKQEILRVKKELIHKEFVKLLDACLKFTDEELKHYVISRIKSSSCKKDDFIKVNASDLERYNRLFSNKPNDLEKLNKELKMNLTLSKEPANIKGGFIIENSLFDIDNSYEEQINELEETLEKEIATMLFRNEE